MVSSLFDQNFAKTITAQAEEPQPAKAAGAGTVSTLQEAAAGEMVLMDLNDRRLQRLANILQSVAALIAIIYFIHSIAKK